MGLLRCTNLCPASVKNIKGHLSVQNMTEWLGDARWKDVILEDSNIQTEDNATFIYFNCKCKACEKQ